jgi:carboxypeptidase C (cathepsin A)
VLRLLPPDAVSDKEITVGSRKIAYTATAGTLALFDQNGEKTAAVFYTAYIAKDGNAARRPLTFAFNGGPGAASVYLNLGSQARASSISARRPRRRGSQARRQPRLVARLHRSGDDRSDRHRLGAGTAKPDDGKNFWGVRSDANVLAKVIALYVAKNSRGASPKYLLGESYGGFRAAKVARALQGDQGIVVTGIVMVSPLLETSFQWGSSQYALGAALHFPDAGRDRA